MESQDMKWLRFAVLRHEGIAEPHWDLLLEVSGQELLATWQIGNSPEEWSRAGVTLSAKRIADHRRLYLEYEGPISNNRGHVRRVAEGTFVLLEQSEKRWRIRLRGTIMAELELPLTGVS
jgi:hypothetical protein